MQKFAIADSNNREMCLNNFNCDMGRIVNVNFTEKEAPTVITFSSEADAQVLCERIKKNKKKNVEPIAL